MTKVLVAGGGTTGTIIASVLKSRWGDDAEVHMVYDHSKPGLGVGESTTPAILTYLDIIECPFEEVIRHANCTIKLGIRFKDWLNDGSCYDHNFNSVSEEEVPGVYHKSNGTFGYEIANKFNNNTSSYSPDYLDDNIVPVGGRGTFALHIDASKFSKYIQSRFEGRIKYIDGVISKVITQNNSIKKLILKDCRELTYDLYIDATGNSRSLIKHLHPEWVSRRDCIPVNRSLATSASNPDGPVPPYTLSEASKDGWIWSAPLGNRYGTGYLYSTDHTSDDEAHKRYSQWLKKHHSHTFTDCRTIDFESGYLKEQWIGNCISTGIASGFIEPLESTAIHTVVFQSELISQFYPFRVLDYNRGTYNQKVISLCEEVVDFIRLHYYTKRRDSKFWRYMDDTTPDWIVELGEKAKFDFFNGYDLRNTRNLFDHNNYTILLDGLGLHTPRGASYYLQRTKIYNIAKEVHTSMMRVKAKNRMNVMDHRQYINYVLGSQSQGDHHY